MKKFKKKKQWFIAAMLTVSMPFVFFSFRMEPWRMPFMSTVLSEVFYPFEYGWHKASVFLHGRWKIYFDLKNAAEENIALKQKLATYETNMIDYQNKVHEVERLKNLLEFKTKFNQESLVAEVITISEQGPFHSMRIGRGKNNDIRVGMPVFASGGVVGRIIRAGLYFSDLQLIGDPNFTVDVMIERTRTRGVLNGITYNRCRLLIHRRSDVRIGDTIVTSGIVGGFPKGLPVGQVVRINYDSDSVSQVITIQPWVDYQRLEEVVVLKIENAEVETIVETGGADWITKTAGQISTDESL